MSSIRELKLAQKVAAQQRGLILELGAISTDVDRCEKMIIELKNELVSVNAKYPSPRTTREDVDYLTDLLRCANKKLVWERHISSLQKRLPALLQKMSQLLEDPKNPPAEETRASIARVLHEIQAAMERLQAAKMD